MDSARHHIPDDLSTLGRPNHVRVILISSGAGHHDPIAEDALTVNLIDALRNPPADPAEMTNLTGLDKRVREYVMATPGARELAEQVYEQTLALLYGWADLRSRLVFVHFQCWGGRHRSVALAEEVAALLRADGIGVEVEHRHINRPILPARPAKGGASC